MISNYAIKVGHIRSTGIEGYSGAHLMASLTALRMRFSSVPSTPSICVAHTPATYSARLRSVAADTCRTHTSDSIGSNTAPTGAGHGRRALREQEQWREASIAR